GLPRGRGRGEGRSGERPALAAPAAAARRRGPPGRDALDGRAPEAEGGRPERLPGAAGGGEGGELEGVARPGGAEPPQRLRVREAEPPLPVLRPLRQPGPDR